MTALVQQSLVRRSALAGALLVAVAMLIGFYSIVAGAVEHGAQRKEMASAAALSASMRMAAAPLPRSAGDGTDRVSLASADD